VRSPTIRRSRPELGRSTTERYVLLTCVNSCTNNSLEENKKFGRHKIFHSVSKVTANWSSESRSDVRNHLQNVTISFHLVAGGYFYVTFQIFVFLQGVFNFHV